jgi:predicted nucleotidyltransferase
MRRAINPNLTILEKAVEQLGELIDEVVFVGGCATGLLITDAAAPPIRMTLDVDVITELATLGEYYVLAEKLRQRGFVEDMSPEAPVCRWKIAGILLDVMPADPGIFGFGSIWYQPALENAANILLPSGKSIRMVTAPYFLTTKLAAFDQRGRNDYQMSHDIEDIIAVLDGRPEIVKEISQAATDLRLHLAARFLALKNNGAFIEALPGHMPSGTASQARVPIIIERIKQIGSTK